MRLMLTVVGGVRCPVGAVFLVTVELDTSDQRQVGFVERDALAVVEALDEARVS